MIHILPVQGRASSTTPAPGPPRPAGAGHTLRGAVPSWHRTSPPRPAGAGHTLPMQATGTPDRPPAPRQTTGHTHATDRAYSRLQADLAHPAHIRQPDDPHPAGAGHPPAACRCRTVAPARRDPCQPAPDRPPAPDRHQPRQGTDRTHATDRTYTRLPPDLAHLAHPRQPIHPKAGRSASCWCRPRTDSDAPGQRPPAHQAGHQPPDRAPATPTPPTGICALHHADGNYKQESGILLPFKAYVQTARTLLAST